MKVGHRFVSPNGPAIRFPVREMKVASVWDFGSGDGIPARIGGTWVADDDPVRWLPSDRCHHSTFELDDCWRVLPTLAAP